MNIESAITKDVIDWLCDIAEQTPIDGCFVEVGVWRGGSAYYLSQIAEQQKRQIFLYDTFEGMPYANEIDYHKVGDFKECDYDAVKKLIPYANVIKGIFPQSMIEMPQIAFAHIDTDQYKSIKDAAMTLSPFMMEGGIMVFDDYGIAHLLGATKAVDEVFGDRVIKDSVKAYVQF